jgi:hypothetical protein
VWALIVNVGRHWLTYDAPETPRRPGDAPEAGGRRPEHAPPEESPPSHRTAAGPSCCSRRVVWRRIPRTKVPVPEPSFGNLLESPRGGPEVPATRLAVALVGGPGVPTGSNQTCACDLPRASTWEPSVSVQRPSFRPVIGVLVGGTFAFARPGVGELLVGGCLAVILLGVVVPAVWAKPSRRRAALAVLAELRRWIISRPVDAGPRDKPSA